MERARCCSRTRAAVTSTSAISTAATGSPSTRAFGIERPRDLYDLRHTYATFALRAGVPVFALSRFMGASIAMIDLHYGHLAVDSYEHAVSLLDALALEWARGRWVGAGAQARKAAQRHGFQGVPKAFPAGGGRSVDVEVRSRHAERCQKGLISRNFAKPSDGLEPSTPSLPWRIPIPGGGAKNRARRALSPLFQGFVRSATPPLNRPESPRPTSNLSPEPSPRCRACTSRWRSASLVREAVGRRSCVSTRAAARPVASRRLGHALDWTDECGCDRGGFAGRAATFRCCSPPPRR